MVGVLLDYGTPKEHRRDGLPFKVLFRVGNTYGTVVKNVRKTATT